MEYCNFVVIVCPTCGKQYTETCGVYAMAGGFYGEEDECEKCREERRKKREADTSNKELSDPKEHTP